MSESAMEDFLKNIDLEKEEFIVKIADFGFSKRIKNYNELIRTICGTPLYMAPQVVQKASYSYKADIWSVGVILFELINGVTPFHSRNREEFEKKVNACEYSFKNKVKSKLTIEALYFMS